MTHFPHHERLYLSDFTTFAEVEFTFSPHVNVFIGENGTGKTHLLKLLYAVQSANTVRRREAVDELEHAVANVFQIANGQRWPQLSAISTLVRQPIEGKYTVVNGSWDGKMWDFVIADGAEVGYQLRENISHPIPVMPRPVFIPAIDMMGHTRRFLSTYDEYQIDFDQTHRDIVALLLAPERRQPVESTEVAELLASLLGGKVEEENERFYLRTPEGRQPMPLVAEGLRKIATLYQLVRNGFLGPGCVLFWDEPEVNLNPKLMDEVVDVLLQLARSGVQIFLATHSYVLLKEFDLQAHASDKVRYFGLERTETGTIPHAAEDYAELHPNAIAEQFDYLYDRELDRSIGRKRR